MVVFWFGLVEPRDQVWDATIVDTLPHPMPPCYLMVLIHIFLRDVWKHPHSACTDNTMVHGSESQNRSGCSGHKICTFIKFFYACADLDTNQLLRTSCQSLILQFTKAQ